jgi:hypothetical protein
MCGPSIQSYKATQIAKAKKMGWIPPPITRRAGHPHFSAQTNLHSQMRYRAKPGFYPEECAAARL